MKSKYSLKRSTKSSLYVNQLLWCEHVWQAVLKLFSRNDFGWEPSSSQESQCCCDESDKCGEYYKRKNPGLNRDLNPGPPAPEAGIIPLDHWATLVLLCQIVAPAWSDQWSCLLTLILMNHKVLLNFRHFLRHRVISYSFSFKQTNHWLASICRMR